MGILVGLQERATAETLYALSSCCPGDRVTVRAHAPNSLECCSKRSEHARALPKAPKIVEPTFSKCCGDRVAINGSTQTQAHLDAALTIGIHVTLDHWS